MKPDHWPLSSLIEKPHAISRAGFQKDEGLILSRLEVTNLTHAQIGGTQRMKGRIEAEVSRVQVFYVRPLAQFNSGQLRPAEHLVARTSSFVQLGLRSRVSNCYITNKRPGNGNRKSSAAALASGNVTQAHE